MRPRPWRQDFGAGAGSGAGGRQKPAKAISAARLARARSRSRRRLVLTPGSLGAAQAQRLLQVSGAKRTAAVTVAVGKTEDVRTDGAFTDIIVGDPDIADVSPLTDRTLSILGKKIGTTRVTLYGEGKMLIGMFDVEVSYDVTPPGDRDRPLQRRQHQGVVGQRPHPAVRHRADAATLDQAVTIARQFAPDLINTVQVLQPQQVMLEVRFVEASRQASRELGVQWNSFGQNTLTNIGSGLRPASCRSRSRAGIFSRERCRRKVGGPNVRPGLPISPIVAAGVLVGRRALSASCSARSIAAALPIDVALNALEQKGLARSLAEPNLVALSGDTASFLAGGEFPIPVPGSLGTVTDRLQAIRRRPGLHADRAQRRPDQPEDRARGQPARHQPSGPGRRHRGAAADRAPRQHHDRAARRPELRARRPAAERRTTDAAAVPWLGDVPVLGALFRSASYQKNETDLAIIVTPHLVRPTAPGDAVKTPLDNTLPANDVDFFLMGKAEITPADARIAVGQTAAVSSATCSICRREEQPMSSQSRIRADPSRLALRRDLSLVAWARCSAAARTSTPTAATPSALGGRRRVATDRATQMIDPWPRDSGRPQHRVQRREDAGARSSATAPARSSRRNVTTSSTRLSAGRAGGRRCRRHGRAAAVRDARRSGQVTARARTSSRMSGCHESRPSQQRDGQDPGGRRDGRRRVRGAGARDLRRRASRSSSA